MSLCHPDKKHWAKGECRTCYYRVRSRSIRQKYERSDKGKASRKLSRVLSDPDGTKVRERVHKYLESLSPDQLVSHNWSNNLSRFGLTQETYNHMVTAQGGVCKICKLACPSGKRLAVDHCHTTGKVRGLLCSRCNPMLGYAQDNIDILLAAACYLQDGPV